MDPRGRAGFTVVEVTMASAILLLALTGVLGGSFAVLKGAGHADLGTQAANLCAERLAYFRACPNPYIAVGGTHYPAPVDRDKELNLNADDDPDVRKLYHNLFNERPALLVREYLYEASESRLKAAATGEDAGRVNMYARFQQRTAGAKMRNFIPPMPEFIGAKGSRLQVVGVFPNWGLVKTPLPLQRPNESVKKPHVEEKIERPMAFVWAPRANDDPLSGSTFTLPADISFVREVWTQTHSPLGIPYTSEKDRLAMNQTMTMPAFYTGTEGSELLEGWRRDPTKSVDANAGTSTMPVPLWTVTVTVRVFKRDPRVLTVRNSSTAYDPAAKGSGLGYNPAKPLATMVGYFSLRRTLRY